MYMHLLHLRIPIIYAMNGTVRALDRLRVQNRSSPCACAARAMLSSMWCLLRGGNDAMNYFVRESVDLQGIRGHRGDGVSLSAMKHEMMQVIYLHHFAIRCL